MGLNKYRVAGFVVVIIVLTVMLIFNKSILSIGEDNGNHKGNSVRHQCVPPSEFVGKDLPQCMYRWFSFEGANRDEFQKYMKDSTTIMEKFSHITKSTVEHPNSHAAMTFYKPEFGHTFQHFLQGYLPFFSSILWMQRLHGIGNVQNLDYLVLNYKNSRIDFWGRHDSFIREFLNSILKVHTKAIVAPSCIQDEQKRLKMPVLPNASFYYFAHPSDAYTLANDVLDLDPCRLSNAAPSMLEHLRILIVDRKYNRKIKNLQHVVNTVADIHPNHRHPEVVLFDGLTMQQQLRFIVQSDIVMFAHGAAIANLAFANPCTGVIEVLPYGYCTASFYRDLYNSIDAVAYSWYDERPQDYSQDLSCNKIIQSAALVENSTCHVSFSKGTAARQCLRKMDIHVDTDILRRNLLKVISERKKCIQTHPFLNRSSAL